MEDEIVAIYDGLEIFTKIYNDEISPEDCITWREGNIRGCLLRNSQGQFNMEQLLPLLLNKTYDFAINNQEKTIEMLNEAAKLQRIEQLEKELVRLRGMDQVSEIR